MLVVAIIIARDRACTDIGGGPDLRIANVSQVIYFATGRDRALLDLDEVTDLDVRSQLRSWPQS